MIFLMNNVVSRTFCHTLYFCVSNYLARDNPLMFVMMYLESNIVSNTFSFFFMYCNWWGTACWFGNCLLYFCIVGTIFFSFVFHLSLGMNLVLGVYCLKHLNVAQDPWRQMHCICIQYICPPDASGKTRSELHSLANHGCAMISYIIGENRF